MSLSVNDFLAGWGAGMCGLVVGHPADTIKVRQQVLNIRGLRNIFITTVQQEGILSFYRGLSIPLVVAGIQNSLFFGVYGNTLRYLQVYQGADESRKSCGEHSVPNKFWHLNVYLAGFTAGFAHSFLVCPVDLVKIKMQANVRLEKSHKLHLNKCIKQIFKTSGFFGFYHGYTATIIRDVPSYGLYVLLYEHFLGYFGFSSNKEWNGYTLFNQFISGGLAGTISWICVTPLDVIKSRIQADDILKPRYRGVIDCIVQSYREGGFRIFGRGFWVHALRGFPVNAATFVGYEWCLQLFPPFIK